MVNLVRQAKKEKIKFVDLWFTDLVGSVKNVTISIKDLSKALNDGIWFDGSSIEGFGRICESDMYLVPDPETYTVIPWSRPETKTVRLICDVYAPNHKPFEGDPRSILKKIMSRAKKSGYQYKVGPELEFFIFNLIDGAILPTPYDSVGYFDLGGDRALSIRKSISNILSQFKIDAEASHHEVAQGQHELDIRYNYVLKVADDIITAKIVVKRVAEEHDLVATFMPKPLYGVNGSGMHVHQSIFKDKKNLFIDRKDRYGLSKIAYHFLAGQLSHIREMTAILAPLVNSYKRLVPGYEAPVYICWGQMNRSALIRIPKISTGKLVSTRIEIRCLDPSTNPYLAFAVLLAAGLDGVKCKAKPPKPVEESVYEFEEADFRNHKIKSLPGSLWEALTDFRRSSLMEEALGNHLFNKYYEIKKREWDEYRQQVTTWETEKYLKLY
ncbi:MAG TPA: glutamine synthetase [bacterium (Candidatus Stahlbacteria)]|nr:glutamine synthetase [Candidatus Stahlbacteria bacterium]